MKQPTKYKPRKESDEVGCTPTNEETRSNFELIFIEVTKTHSQQNYLKPLLSLEKIKNYLRS